MKTKAVIWAVLSSWLLFEAGSFIFYEFVRPSPESDAGGELLEMRRADGIPPNDPSLRNEVRFLYYTDVKYHPYRWYQLQPNYKGRMTSTDSEGFRNDPNKISRAAPSIAFFGGSTTYSTHTGQSQTIPVNVAAELKKSWSIDLQPLKFGIGGYSSGAELMTLIEVARLYSNIRVAVFYDGANDVGRFVEKLQYQDLDPIYGAMSYPFMPSVDNAIHNRFSGRLAVLGGWYHAPEPGFPYLWYQARKRLVPRIVALSGAWDPRHVAMTEPVRSAEDYRRIAQSIAAQYVQNVLDIKAVAERHGIVPVFTLQPLVFDKTTRTKREDALVAAMRAKLFDMEKLYALTYQAVREDVRLKAVHFFDLSKVFSDQSEPIFYDFVHVNSAGNKAVSSAIAARIHSLVEK